MKVIHTSLLLLLGLISVSSPVCSQHSNGMSANVHTGPRDIARLASLTRYGSEQPAPPSAHPFYIKSSIIRGDSMNNRQPFEMKQTDEMREEKERILGGLNLREEYAKRKGKNMM